MQSVLDQNSPIPLYYQIRENLREMIHNGTFLADQLIPSERELSEHYNVNRLTVRQAITELVHEGLLRRQHGKGTFVMPQKVTHDMPNLAGFSERMIRAGHIPTSKILSITRQVPSHSAARALNIAVDSDVFKLVRLRLVNDEPVMLETSYLAAYLLPGLEIDDFYTSQSLYDLLKARYNIAVVEADEVIEPVILTDYEAQILQTQTGRAAMLLEGTIFIHGHIPIEFTKSLVRGDKSRFYFRLHNLA